MSGRECNTVDKSVRSVHEYNGVNKTIRESIRMFENGLGCESMECGAVDSNVMV